MTYPDMISGQLTMPSCPVALVAARFNVLVVERLVNGAIDTLQRLGFQKSHLSVFWVPGAYDLPLVLQRLAKSQKFSGLIALGAVVRGDTYHFEIVANNNASAMMNLMLNYNLPITNAVLTTDTMEQALDRAGGKSGNKGSEAAIALVEILSLLQQIEHLK
jgi:6,7-dimethyl-8-ribityllumazine synthase